MPERHDLVLCADDFGLAADIDAGILALVARGRLSATGCMVGGPAFVADSARLHAVADGIDVGMHFFLTDLPTLGAVPCLGTTRATPVSLGTVLKRSLTGGIVQAEIRAELERQLERFHAVIGRQPDFIDGHQHVHCFPGVREALLGMFADGTLDANRTWVRDCHDSFGGIVRRGIEVPKTLFISGLSFGLGRAAAKLGVTTNTGFRGITAFTEEPAFASLFPRFLDGAGDGTLVMCHPASPTVAADPKDPIQAARRREFAYLSSEAFPADLERAGLRLARGLQGKARA